MIRLLVVDASALMRRLLATVFTAEGDFTLAFARDGAEALEQAELFRPDVVTLDLPMPPMEGLRCLDRLMLLRPCPVVVFSALEGIGTGEGAAEGSTGAETRRQALRLGAADVVAKPTGAASLSLRDWAPLLVQKVRDAARSRPRRSLRLVERLRAVRQTTVGQRTVGQGVTSERAAARAMPAGSAMPLSVPAPGSRPIGALLPGVPPRKARPAGTRPSGTALPVTLAPTAMLPAPAAVEAAISGSMPREISAPDATTHVPAAASPAVPVAPVPNPATPPPATPPPAIPPPAIPAAPILSGVVLVGVSTGGPQALDVLLGGLPAGFPWPLVVAQHMPATFTGPMARRLDKLCALQVIEVSRPMPLRPGHVYIGQGDADLLIAARPGGLVVLPAPALPGHRWHPSVERLVGSALQHLPPRQLTGVLLTGMGNDGAAGMARLRAGGGHTIAEAEETAVVWGMPGELVRAGGAEQVLPLHAIAAQLRAWAA